MLPESLIANRYEGMRCGGGVIRRKRPFPKHNRDRASLYATRPFTGATSPLSGKMLSASVFGDSP